MLTAIRSHMPRHTCLLFASLVSVAACEREPMPGTDEAPARFASATSDQIGRAVAAGAGGDALFAHFVADLAESAAPSGCPAVARDGDVVTIQGDCTGDFRIAGRAVLTNVSAIHLDGRPQTGRDPTRPMELRFEGFELANPDEDGGVTADGTVRQVHKVYQEALDGYHRGG